MTETPAKTDRRAQRSRDAILEALFALMLERGYERLTIQNLIDRAGVGRATFYAHFQSKDELLAASIARLRGWLEQAGRARGDEPLGFTLPFFQHLASHRRIYEMTVARESEASVERHVKQMLTDLVRQDLRRRHAPITGARLDLATHYVVGALWSSFIWWMESTQPLPPEDLNAQFQRLCFPGLDVAVAA
ncbi:MAG TPA: TetR/AcrR family transcriptional regulator [Roseateles sp.]